MTTVRTRTRRSRRIVVIGVGNADRGDDAAGLLAAQLLRDRLRHIDVLEAVGNGIALMESWKDAETAVLIDAVRSGAAPGTIHRLNAHERPLPAAWLYCSTHALGVAEAIELSRALRCLPPRLVIYGIEGGIFETGATLSTAVELATQRAVERVARDVRRWLMIPTRSNHA